MSTESGLNQLDINVLPQFDKTAQPEPLQNPLLAYMAGLIMKDGKRRRAQLVIQDTLSEIRRRTGADAMPILVQAIDLAAPSLKIARTKKGAKVIETPLALKETVRVRSAVKAIVEAAAKRKKADRDFPVRFAKEILAVVEGNSEVIKKKITLNKQAVLLRSAVGIR